MAETRINRTNSNNTTQAFKNKASHSQLMPSVSVQYAGHDATNNSTTNKPPNRLWRYSREELVDIKHQQQQQTNMFGDHHHNHHVSCGSSFDDSDSAITGASYDAMVLKIPMSIRRSTLMSSTSSTGDDADVMAILQGAGCISPTGSISPGSVSPTAKKQYSRKELVYIRGNSQPHDGDGGVEINSGNHQLLQAIAGQDEDQRRLLAVIPPEIRRGL